MRMAQKYNLPALAKKKWVLYSFAMLNIIDGEFIGSEKNLPSYESWLVNNTLAKAIPMTIINKKYGPNVFSLFRSMAKYPIRKVRG